MSASADGSDPPRCGHWCFQKAARIGIVQTVEDLFAEDAGR